MWASYINFTNVIEFHPHRTFHRPFCQIHQYSDGKIQFCLKYMNGNLLTMFCLREVSLILKSHCVHYQHESYGWVEHHLAYIDCVNFTIIG
jgi:hypothetical protein